MKTASCNGMIGKTHTGGIALNVQILELIDGAKAAKGLTVIIDVFRAMTVEAPVTMGAVIVPDVFGTEVIATQNVE